MDYPLCDRTVTIYRNTGQQILRRVAHNCYYAYEDCLTVSGNVPVFQRKCLLIQPGPQLLQPGDRVLAGEGPEVTVEGWDTFLPETVAGLSQIRQAKPWYLDGQICHYEGS